MVFFTQYFLVAGTTSHIFNMEDYNDYISEDKIVSCLCKIRAKYARQRCKKHLVHLLTKDKKYNYHKQEISETEKRLKQLLPSRKKWKELSKKKRYKNGQLLNSIKKNILSLKITIKYYKETNPSEPFLLRLNDFIKEVDNSIKDRGYSFSPPEIIPKLKEDKKGKGKNIYRPIASFSLNDRIIICLTNRYFTDLFDSYFLDCSLAFRSQWDTKGRRIFTHHDAIGRIIEYKKRFKGKHLWVAECDMKKFYDSVNHTVIKKSFNRLITKVKKEKGEYYNSVAERIFYRYLECYTFNKNVLKLSENDEYFTEKHVEKGEFGWVSKELLKLKYYKSFKNAKIGIPQGGALSGLIANIVLDYTDRKVVEADDEDLLYIRYCDDMIIMHPNKEKCKKALNSYRNTLKKLKLVPHKCKNTAYGKSYWKGKSKGPYKWDANGIPWVGFVGYEINYNNHVRVRKGSLKKQMQKQYDTVNEVRLAIKDGKKRKNIKMIEESTINRLIGMSVGRVNIWNYKNANNDMCWINGFLQLNDNKYSRIQLRALDRCRNRLIFKLRTELSNIKDDGSLLPIKKNRKKHHQIIYYGKPFSYYYHVIEKKKECG